MGPLPASAPSVESPWLSRLFSRMLSPALSVSSSPLPRPRIPVDGLVPSTLPFPVPSRAFPWPIHRARRPARAPTTVSRDLCARSPGLSPLLTFISLSSPSHPLQGPLPHTPWDPYLTPHGTTSLPMEPLPHTSSDPPSHPMLPLTPHGTLPHTPWDPSHPIGPLTLHGTSPSHSTGLSHTCLVIHHMEPLPHTPWDPADWMHMCRVYLTTLAAQPSLPNPRCT